MIILYFFVVSQCSGVALFQYNFVPASSCSAVVFQDQKLMRLASPVLSFVTCYWVATRWQ